MMRCEKHLAVAPTGFASVSVATIDSAHLHLQVHDTGFPHEVTVSTGYFTYLECRLGHVLFLYVTSILIFYKTPKACKDVFFYFLGRD
ncbi:hypothetical protein GGR53DRAFT_474538 [Hypoxylon sp. FL1150]|nr:hypothetical protein GGR53DRAFT_474538 [Hypoxylon sp. FL1150]